ncbi:hypothetical protein A3H03_01455 [Candidatus Kuenenbacteria bacterium RIFCSPLOWO2_12_FULL_42_13]|uniref:Uncharacterized protein n=3 Tax=Candidatus Kueneniibacteriota TaxID=1752740 RepID=A0A1F6G2Y7_9BACT|nr:MAG: hypothetical protein A3H55_00380 [Candidatus Kuenenbacteria bacterium RIFCSPLOWO2_02_FULL_42_16]OGG92455.1 MAG: hypothetical protein A3H03_01455 [Candidatus Kuenenbacteria bacterium RIFCSPLOWO2_12_FULL_42_13]OGG98900.1 MAG: hypothetical protein A3E04_01065 [Candidatus Kuenenbacteria bacterium RIFCSPHIGHO2_12_FULL_42_14]
MKNKVYQKSITLGDLGKFTEKVILPGVERIVDKRIQPLEKQMDGFEKRMGGFEKRMGGFENELKLVRMEVRQSKNEILNSEDKIVGELKKARQEQAAMYLNYQKIEARVYKLETIVKILAEKLKIKIEDILPAE